MLLCFGIARPHSKRPPPGCASTTKLLGSLCSWVSERASECFSDGESRRRQGRQTRTKQKPTTVSHSTLTPNPVAPRMHAVRAARNTPRHSHHPRTTHTTHTPLTPTSLHSHHHHPPTHRLPRRLTCCKPTQPPTPTLHLHTHTLKVHTSVTKTM